MWINFQVFISLVSGYWFFCYQFFNFLLFDFIFNFLCILQLFHNYFIYIFIKVFHCILGFSFTSADFGNLIKNLCMDFLLQKYLQINNFGQVIYNKQNCIIFYLHCYVKQKHLFYSKNVQSFYKFLIETRDTFTGFFMIRVQA